MKNISSNKNLITIAVVCVCCVIIFAAVIVLVTRGKSDDTNITNNNRTGMYIDENEKLIVAEGSDYLPDSCVGSWEIAKNDHVLQSPRNTDISEEDAVKAEYNGEDVLLAYNCYKTTLVGSVFSPFYKVNTNGTLDMMDAVGMQSDGIADELGEISNITQIEVYDQSGTQKYDTIFIIDAKKEGEDGKKHQTQYLVYYGTGNFVFGATKVEAVG